jgi:hypothetical protein
MELHPMANSNLKYQPGHFATLANTPFGAELWTVLSSSDSIREMMLASDLGHPAVEGVEERLLENFETEILDDRNKQMAGHMVRQIMENKGFVVDQSNVTIGSVPFSKGTRYRRPDWYRVYVFRNSGDPRDICFSAVRTGAKLPNIGKNRWLYAHSFATKLRAAVAFGIRNFDALREELEQNGIKRYSQARILRAAN